MNERELANWQTSRACDYRRMKGGIEGGEKTGDGWTYRVRVGFLGAPRSGGFVCLGGEEGEGGERLRSFKGLVARNGVRRHARRQDLVNRGNKGARRGKK